MEGDLVGRWTIALRSLCFLLAVVCATAMPVYAANDCPWLNEATASGLLGGGALGAYQAGAAEKPAVCTFTQRSSEFTRILKIEVEITHDFAERLKALERSCGSSISPLPAIGNEAVSCSTTNRGKALEEAAFGRVRDQVFTIKISSSKKTDPVLRQEMLEMLIHTAAEQVSGNLF